MKSEELLRFLRSPDPASDLVVDGVRLGSSVELLHETLGEPKSTSYEWHAYDAVSFLIEEDRVARVSFRKRDQLDPLGLDSAEALVEVLGSPDRRLGARGRSTWGYLARGIEVDVAHEPFRVDALRLGEITPPESAWLFRGGFPAQLLAVEMRHVYAGVLAGVPARRHNDAAIQGLLKRAAEQHPDQPVHLIEPARRVVERANPRFGPGELLPPVACIGLFRSRFCARDLTKDLSMLVVAWFQDAMELPGDRTRFFEVDWTELAADEEW